MKNKEYSIPFAGLKQGKHKFEYQIDNTFFESFDYHEFNDAAIGLNIVLEKMATVLEFEMNTKGIVNLHCDLTNEPFDQKTEASLKLLVKFGESYNDEDDEILILPHGEHQVNIAQYIYEMIVLSVPSKRIHPGVLDGTLNSEALEKLEELRPKENKKDKNNIDPRWEVLKKLLTDK
ncbi:MAG: DUF177 domain-containing protein [Flavobacteriaceae bacterium]|nr:MAG: DUF177 domain-containing protein [Flavobacteriaceae bacterium]